MEKVIDKLKVEKYSSYKDSGIEWSGLVPENWEALPIRAIFEERNEKNEGRKTDYILSVTKDRGVIPYDEKGAIGNNKSEDIERYKLVYPNDFVINKMNVVIGSLGMSKYFGAFSQVYLVYKPRTSQININYYSYIFSNPSFYKSLIKYCTGIMELRESLNKEDFKKLILPFPDYQTQTAIVEYLDRKTVLINQAIGIKQKQIELLKERRQILIHKAVTRGLNPNVTMKNSGVEWIGEVPEGWEVRKIKYISQVLRGKFTHRPRNDERFYDGEFPFIQTGDISSTEKYITTYSQTLNKRGFNVSKEFPIGTIVLTITGSNTGEVGILGIKACFPDSIVGFFPVKDEDTNYLYECLFLLRNILIKSSTINTQMNLNLERVSSQYLPVPKLAEQKQIVEYLEIVSTKIATAISLKVKEIQRLKEYKSVLINNAVTGKIKVC